MDPGKRPPAPAPGKPGPTSGISAAEFTQLKTKVESLERQLSEALAERNQWNSVLRRWQDAEAVVKFRLQGCAEVIAGKISWVDRYTIGILMHNITDEEPTIIHKGAIVTVTV
jgi:hypothetical protein